MVPLEAAEKPKNLFDLTVNLPTVISIIVLIFSAALGLSRFETKIDHDLDIKQTQALYVHQDVQAVSDRALQEWREEIRTYLKAQTEQMDRIEKKLDTVERSHR